MQNPLPFTYRELADTMAREAALRRRCYPTWNKVSTVAELPAGKLAEILRMDAAADHFRALAEAEPPAAPAETALTKPAAGPDGQLVVYASAAQKEHLICLLNHVLITRSEKTKMLLAINRLPAERAEVAIAKVRATIEEREGTDPREAVRASLRRLVKEEGDKLPDEDSATALLETAADPDATLAFLEQALQNAGNAVLDTETFGTAAELAEAEADA